MLHLHKLEMFRSGASDLNIFYLITTWKLHGLTR